MEKFLADFADYAELFFRRTSIHAKSQRRKAQLKTDNRRPPTADQKPADRAQE
jgi:hypothetical protein